MTKSKVVMVDFWSTADNGGKPVGHGVKVGNEYYTYLKDAFEVKHFVNKSIVPFIKNCKVQAFRDSLEFGMPKGKRVLKNFRCLREAFRSEKDSLIWIYLQDIYGLLYLAIFPKHKNKVAVTIYDIYSENKLKHYILKSALKKADVVFVTNRKISKELVGSFFIPDYAYDNFYYERFLTTKKKEQAVCLGTMNEKKLLRESVEAFKKNGYPLYIAGQFLSVETFQYLNCIKGNNIIIENRFIENEEYYKLMAESKYCLIPYDAEFYKNRTSGVIQESLFCRTIPISHKEILEFANVDGIGYEKLDDLKKINLREINIEDFRQKYDEEINGIYKYDAVKNTVVSAIKKGLGHS
jgi:hypothetical protein